MKNNNKRSNVLLLSLQAVFIGTVLLMLLSSIDAMKPEKATYMDAKLEMMTPHGSGSSGMSDPHSRRNLLRGQEQRDQEQNHNNPRMLQGSQEVGSSCLDYDLFADDFGDGCAWYFEDFHLRCEEQETEAWRNTQTGFSAADACCICGGGHRHGNVMIEPIEVTSFTDNCRNVPGFFDIDYDGCELYAQNPSHYCGLYGDHLDFLPGMTANIACCACGGGIQRSNPSSMSINTLQDKQELDQLFSSASSVTFQNERNGQYLYADNIANAISTHILSPNSIPDAGKWTLEPVDCAGEAASAANARLCFMIVNVAYPNSIILGTNGAYAFRHTPPANIISSFVLNVSSCRIAGAYNTECRIQLQVGYYGPDHVVSDDGTNVIPIKSNSDGDYWIIQSH